jgi:hypothetical protein
MTGLPQFWPQAWAQFWPQVSPQQVSPQVWPQASSPQASPQSPQVSPQVSPPQVSPGGLFQVPVTFAQGVLGEKPTFNAGEAPLTEGQARELLQRSGVDVPQILQESQASPFSLSPAAGYDGSYIRPFGADTGQDVAGWDMWDSRTRIGTMLLGVNDRVGILIEGTNLSDPNALLEISRLLNFDEINRVIEEYSK